jgi:hypothetical protein
MGAEDPEWLERRYGAAQLEELVANGWLALIPTPFGPLAVLGPVGRRSLGLAPYYKSPPEAAATQLLRRRARESLESRGWTYLGRPYRQLMSFTTPDGTCAYVLIQYHDPTARAIRRVLSDLSADLMRDGSRLLVWTQHPRRLHGVSRRHPGLLAFRTYRWPWGADGES